MWLALLALVPQAGISVSEAGAVLFAQNSAKLTPAACTLLTRLAPMLKEGRVRLEGHCDRSEKRTAPLSLERARAVQRFLVQKGVPAARMRVVGLAATRPLAKGEGEEARRQNRRVELVQSSDYD